MKPLVILLLSLWVSIVSYGQGTPSEKYRRGINIGDSNYISLKNGDTLIYKDQDDDDLQAVTILKHSNNRIKLSADFNIWFWLEMDGSDYFMTGSAGRGSSIPEKIDVFRKSDGADVFSTFGFMLYNDTIRNVVVYDDEEKHTGYFTVYYLNTNTYSLYKEPASGPCIYCFWDSVKLTTTELQVTYQDTAHKTKTLRYRIHPAASILSGTWALLEFKDLKTGQRTDTATTGIGYEIHKLRLTFKDSANSGIIKGSTFCNDVEGFYKLYSNNKIAISRFGGTMVACLYEDKLSEAMLAASSYKRNNDTLYILYNHDTEEMVFKPVK